MEAKTRHEKLCTRCGVVKPLEDFARASKRTDGRQSVCKDCGLDLRRTTQRNSDLKRKFGMSAEDYDAMLDKQDHRCMICGRHESALANTGNGIRLLAVDHNHATGTVRDLLCYACNTGLGSFRDDPNVLEAAAAYLRKWDAT